MVNQLKDGVVGLALFLSQWLSAGGQVPAITLAHIQASEKGIYITTSISITVKEQLNDLLDAGIPIRLRMQASSDAGDTLTLLRTLSCNISDYTYTIIDSSVNMKPAYRAVSKRYTQALVAFKDYVRFEAMVSPTSRTIHFEAMLLPSKASQLNRSVDMSSLLGFQKISKTFTLR